MTAAVGLTEPEQDVIRATADLSRLDALPQLHPAGREEFAFMPI